MRRKNISRKVAAGRKPKGRQKPKERKRLPLSPKAVKRAEALIRGRKMNDSQVVKKLVAEGLTISLASVLKLRNKLGLPSITRGRSAEVDAFRKRYQRMSVNRRLGLWSALESRRVRTEDKLFETKWRMGAYKPSALDGKGPKYKKCTQIVFSAIDPLLLKLAEVKVKQEALFPLLPEEIQREANALDWSEFVSIYLERKK